MKHIKKFDNEQSLISYKKNNFITPHLYFDNSNRNINYMPKYKVLDYISSTSTGGQYIDLGCHLLENTDDIQIDIKFNIKGVGKTSTGGDNTLCTLIASQPEVSPWPGFVLRRHTASRIDLHLQAKWNFTNSVKDSSNKYQSKYLTYPVSSGSSTFTGAPWQTIYEFSEILDNMPASQINNCTCTLFCALNSSNQPFRYALADLYYLRFIKGGQVIRNLIPVKKLSTNEVGLYDLENDHLYVSQGDEPFVEPII